jgi:hypothetical protein
LRVFLARIFHYRGPFDPQLIADLSHPERRFFLLSAVENYTPDYEHVLNAIDVFCMTFQSAHLKRGQKPKSMFKQSKNKKSEKPYFYETVRDPQTGEMTKYKVYY